MKIYDMLFNMTTSISRPGPPTESNFDALRGQDLFGDGVAHGEEKRVSKVRRVRWGL